MENSKTYIAIPPGETIKEQLGDRGMTQKEFAARMGYSQKHISQLINGQVRLMDDTAQRLESVLGIPATFWLNLENNYRLELHKVEEENDFEEDKEIARKMPYADSARLGWVKKTRKIGEKVTELRKFFRVARLSSIDNMNHQNAIYRKLGATKNSEYAKIMWIQQVQNLAELQKAETINIKRLEEHLEIIRSMTKHSPQEYLQELDTLLKSCGVVLILIPHLPGSFLHGATFLDKKKIIIGLTIRRKDADIFWFSLFHEIGHIINGDVFESDPVDEVEDYADTFAADLLIPRDAYRAFVKNDDFGVHSVISFSKEVAIHPGIVVGRLQKEGHIKYSELNDLKEQYEFV